MPTKTSRGGHLKSHNRSASATTHNLGKHAITGTGGATGYPQVTANTDITRTKSGEKIRRTGSDLQPLQRAKNAFPYAAYQQHPVHQAQPDRTAGYQSKKRGITVLEVQTTSDGDDDEWVSSESGAVTPADNDEEEGPPTPKDTVTMLPNPQQHTSQSPTSDATEINLTSKTALNHDIERNPNNTMNHKPPHVPNATADPSSNIQPTRPVLPPLQFQSQAQLHPMTRTHATSTTSAKQRSVSSLVSAGTGTRKATPAPQSDHPGPSLGQAERVQSHSANPNNNGVDVQTSTEAIVSNTNNNQQSQSQTLLPESEQSATPRVAPSPLRPTFSDASRSKSFRPHARPRPQSLADIQLIDTNVKPGNEEADDTFVESPATELPPSRTRPPSTRSMRSIYHHPLIRTRSYAPSTPTVTATAPPAFSPTTASPTLTPNPGSGAILGNLPSNTTSEATHYFWPYKLKRQNSQSSVNSVATLPLTSTSTSAALAPTTSTNVTATRERPRTLSHTSAALSSLAAAAAQPFHHYGFGVPSFVQHAPSRPPSPPLPVMFPPPPKSVHPMLPAELTESHLSATAFQRIMADSFMRIEKAKIEKVK